MSNTHTTPVRDGDAAVIFYGDESTAGRVVKVVASRSGAIRRVGIVPDGTDVVAWFSPAPDTEGLVSVGGSTVAYV
jgi:hypothetical protein